MKVTIDNINYTTISLDDDEDNEIMRIKVDHENNDEIFDISFSNAEDYSLEELLEVKKAFDRAIKLYKTKAVKK